MYLFFQTVPRITPKTDIYGFGLILWEMKSGLKPNANLKFEEVCQNMSLGKRPKVPEDVPEEIKILISQCWSQDPRDRPNCEEILHKLNQMSFPDQWKALLANGSSSNISPISVDSIEENDMEPRTSILYARSFSAPLSIPVPPPPPPPPQPLQTLPPSRQQVVSPVKNCNSSIPRPGFAVTSEEIQKQMNNLRKVDKDLCEHANELKPEQTQELMNMLKKVIDKRRESIYNNNDFSESSNASSGRVSRCGSVKRLSLSAKSWSGDEI